MATLLRIDASTRGEDSYSRRIADAFERHWCDAHPGGIVVRRDLAGDPVAHLTAQTIQGFFSPQEQLNADLRAATALSDELVAELLAADTLLISTPMYNFSVPSALKAWIDQIVRIDRTFGASRERGLYGLVHGKKAVVATAAGAAYQRTDLTGMDFLQPYLRALLGFLGFEDIEFVVVENTTLDSKLASVSHAAALDKALRLAS